MGRLRVFSGHEVRKLLQGQGFVQVRQKGSHVIMQKRREGTTISVPVPLHRELKTGTLRAIIRQAQLPRSLFE